MKPFVALGGSALILSLFFVTSSQAAQPAPQYFAQLAAQLPFHSYVVMTGDGEVIFEKNPDVPYPIASLTKLMTAHLLAEEVRNWDAVLTYNKKEHYAYRNYWHLADGDQVRALDLLYGTLVNSINDPPRMLVKEATALSEARFIQKMNERATVLGLRSMRFADVSGLDARNVSSARDIIGLFRGVLKDPLLYSVLSTQQYAFDEVASADKLVHHAFKHTNRLLRQVDLPFTVIASKTGFIEEAGRTLVMAFRDPTSGQVLFMSAFGGDYADMDLVQFRTLVSESLRLYHQGVRMGQEPPEVLAAIAQQTTKKAAAQKVAQQKKKAIQLAAKQKAIAQKKAVRKPAKGK